MILKEDIEESKERMDAWWDHEIIDRPVISYYYSKKRASIGGYLDALGQDWRLAKNPEGIEGAIDKFEKTAEKTFYGGEAIPSYFPNYGPGIVAAIFGVEPKFQSETIWFSRPTKPEEIIPLLESVELNQNNEWYSRILRITEYAVKRAKDNYQVSITDLGGVLDILSSFLGPTNLLLTMKRKPHIIDTCREIILEKLIKIYDKLYKIIKEDCKGFNAWLNVWCRKSWYPVQCDFIAMLNPKWFKRFALPDIITQIEHMDYAIYHMDGPYQIPFLDDFLSISHLTGIQWVSGAGRQPQGSEEWIPLYKKIQKAGKNVIIDTLSEKVPHLYRNLEHKGLYVRTYYSSKIIADFYLPPFVGGGDGKLIEEAISWVKSNKYPNLNKELLEEFLNTRHYEFDSGVKRQLLTQINSSLKEKLFFT
ncbi:MAG: hypothetical protein ACTSSC_05515 [Promethearchaeota archaeon]